MDMDQEELKRNFYEPKWRIDPSKVGECHLMDFFAQEVWMLEGLAALLGDMASASDEAMQFPKDVRLSLKSLWGLEKSIDRAVWSLRDKCEVLHAHMLQRGVVPYTGKPQEADAQREAGGKTRGR